MAKIVKQHVQLPNNMTDGTDLLPKDLLIYVSIKRYMNGKTKEAFPSIETISKNASCTRNTVMKCIENLKREEYITVRKEGRKNVYKFSPYKNFEPFSYEFLDNIQLSSNEKAYLIVSQQFMFKDACGEGVVCYSDYKLSKKINMSYNSIKKYNQSLEEKLYMIQKESLDKDKETGLNIIQKIFYLDKFNQEIACQVDKNTDDISELKLQVKEQFKAMKEMQRTIDQLSGKEQIIEINEITVV